MPTARPTIEGHHWIEPEDPGYPVEYLHAADLTITFRHVVHPDGDPDRLAEDVAIAGRRFLQDRGCLIENGYTWSAEALPLLVPDADAGPEPS